MRLVSTLSANGIIIAILQTCSEEIFLPYGFVPIYCSNMVNFSLLLCEAVGAEEAYLKVGDVKDLLSCMMTQLPVEELI